MRAGRRDGVILLVVLVFALLLASTVATFARRSTIDMLIARNREASARAEAIARGGVRLATALVLEDLIQEPDPEHSFESRDDLWARIGESVIPVGEGATLRVQIRDSGALFNLNALFGPEGVLDEQTEPFLEAFFEKVIDEMPIPPGEKLYDRRELAANLIDWIDADDQRLRGGAEDGYYQSQNPPYRARNRPLLSVDELRLVEGFDARLVDALRPYVTVFPFAGGRGINPNTAPPHVLALIYYDDGVSLRLADEDMIRQILRVREEGGVLCDEGQSGEACTPIRQIVTNAIYPPPTWSSHVFSVLSVGKLGEIERSLEVVIDRSNPVQTRLLSWRVR